MILPVALTIAGSDSGGGAGIQADVKAFHSCGVHGATAITSITSQNTTGVQSRYDLPVEVVVSQLSSIFSDLDVAAAKTGMLANVETVRAVAAFLRPRGLAHLVVDPVMVAKGGAALIDDAAVNAVVEALLPLAEIVTPNVPEAERVSGIQVADRAAMAEAARRIAAAGGCRSVLVKGGHLEGGGAVTDLLYLADSGERVVFEDERLPGRSTHGTGCLLAACIAAYLALGRDVAAAVAEARVRVREGIESGLEIGHGIGPVHLPYRGF